MNDFSFVKTGGSFHQRAGGPNRGQTRPGFNYLLLGNLELYLNSNQVSNLLNVSQDFC